REPRARPPAEPARTRRRGDAMTAASTTLRSSAPEPADGPEAREPAPLLLRDLRTSPAGLSGREAARRLERYGPNELRSAGRATWPQAIARQLTHPLALLLVLASVLAVVAGTPSLAWAILAVVVLNAAFVFVQEHQAGRAVQALGRYLPPQARVRR